MASVTLHGPGFSTYVRSARLALEEKGVGYDLDEFNFIADGMPEAQLGRHPFGKVPALTHGDFVLYEVCAIGRYIDEAFDGPALQPADAQGRARVTQITSVIDSYTYGPVLGSIVIQRLVVPMMGGRPDEAAIAEALPKAEKALAVLDGFVGGGTSLAGEGLTLADLHLVPIYDYFAKTPEGETALAGTPNLRRWWETLSARPSVQKTTPQLG